MSAAAVRGVGYLIGFTLSDILTKAEIDTEIVENAEPLMSVNIKNSATVALAGELARRQGVSKTAAIHQALSERLHRLGHSDQVEEEEKLAELRVIRDRIARMPARDSRNDEEIIGFDAHGLPS